MANKERNIPIERIGGKIRDRRKKLNMTKAQLYNKALGDNGTTDDNKADKVDKWELEDRISAKELKGICDALKVDADYLLGRINAKTHDDQFVSDYTKLSLKSVEIIRDNRELIPHPRLTNKDVQGIDLDAANKRIAEKYPDPEPIEYVDDTNVKFLNALIESKQFNSLYEWFEIYRNTCKEYTSNKALLASLKSFQEHWDEESRAMFREALQADTDLQKSIAAYSYTLAKTFSKFIDDSGIG